MFRKYRYLTLLSVLLLLIGIFIWTLTGRTSLQVAEQKLMQASSYGEVKGVWLEYQKDLGNSPEWEDYVSRKLTETNLNASQKEDLKKWFNPRTTASPVEAAEPAPKAQAPAAAPADTSKYNAAPAGEPGLSGAELAAFYNRQGDEKCKAFKAASAPHLYHIANEYYQRAAAITHSKPSICE